MKDQLIDFFTENDKPYGISFGGWTVKWWQWAYSIPTNINPLVDKNGKYANINQEGPVWFLAGTFAEGKFVERTCSVPHNKSILCPIINYEINPIERPDLDSDSKMMKHVIEDQDDIATKEIMVNNNKIPVFRVKSEPSIFELYINPDNYFGRKGGNTISTSDGYWVFLKYLPIGHHEIFFHGTCSLGTRQVTVKYNIEIK